ncbi:MAG: hypothetical protein HYX67_00315 [Candidatus Melainabacteria bacterium]|nr:hypothetical protein [Candidatus Melainabacteria bacterium]
MKQKLLAPAALCILLTGTTAQLSLSQAPGGSSDPRVNAIYSLMQNGRAREALSQLNAVPNPSALDQYMKGQALELIGQPVKAAEFYHIAVTQDAQNEMFRKKSVDSYLAICKCDEAIQVCNEGSRLATDPKRKQRYDDKVKEIEKLKQNFLIGAENIARHKREHSSQLQAAMENNK